MNYLNKIRAICKERGYSQEEIAKVLETTQQHYSCYENSKNELPIRHLIKLYIFYDVSADWLLVLKE